MRSQSKSSFPLVRGIFLLLLLIATIAGGSIGVARMIAPVMAKSMVIAM